ncbi:hypothetical protein CYY_004591 [Polysphondylium violaceum]|uniref:Serine/threonine-protein phosphatase 2A activator n=1 Tax=Polysphondylium violaceum TaxID=133409 RepID=A0A8J4PV62_9MYCE|nr:hypothetical protein CYY_004591 [Polysphondylium violaceum]
MANYVPSATSIVSAQHVEIEPIDINNHVFVKPIKIITDQTELNKFLCTKQCKHFIDFIQRLGDKIVNKPNSTETKISNLTENIIKMIKELELWIDSIPPLAQPMRYGNKAYRTFYQKLVDNIEQLHQQILPQQFHKAIIELTPYFLDSMGNQTRLDYGTGHELHFVVWMYCLERIGAFDDEDEVAMALKLFPAYLELVRKLQRVYGLEPAGTHGVWSLDDYQFIPFIWGGAQLAGNTLNLKPSSILIEKTVDQYYQDYMYFACIKYINTVKKGPFHEHSRDLFNISGSSSWEKIQHGMMKKFFDDVMTKVPIIQHFLFGSIVHFTLNK